MAEKNDTGRFGENTARNFLEINGYKILDCNWHFHHYELDIVAEKVDEIIVVEVKTRSANYLISPEDTIDNGKIRRTVAAADAYVRQKNINKPVRFDIICLIKKGSAYEVAEHIEDAFMAPIQK